MLSCAPRPETPRMWGCRNRAGRAAGRDLLRKPVAAAERTWAGAWRKPQPEGRRTGRQAVLGQSGKGSGATWGIGTLVRWLFRGKAGLIAILGGLTGWGALHSFRAFH